MKPSPGTRTSCLAVLAALCQVGSVVACGINWAQPKSHFDGVSFQGFVFLVEELGNIELKSGQTLPVRAIFRSESNQTSPYVGNGWEIPLLESQIVQMDERFFRVTEPSGWFRLFWRDEKDPTILHGQGNWKGIVRENSISLVADCGSRLDYRNGKLVSMQIKDEKLDIVRAQDGTASIVQGMSALLVVEKSLSAEALNLRLGSNEPASLVLTDRPIVEVVFDRLVVGRKAQSLGLIEQPDRRRTSFLYAVDGQVNPTIRYNDRIFTWSPVNSTILQSDEWNYDVKLGVGPFANGAIERRNSSGQREFWHHDGAKGEEISEKANGTTTIRKWFTNGVFAGKPRSNINYSAGLETRSQKWNYDETGRLIRDEIKSNSKFAVNIYKYVNGKKLIVSRNLNGIQEINVYNAAGLLEKGFYSNRTTIDFTLVDGMVQAVKSATDSPPLDTVVASFELLENGLSGKPSQLR